MTDPISYRQPDTKDEAGARGRRAARQAIVIGAIVFVLSAGIIAIPFFIARNPFNKYIVAFALVGALAGMSFMLHGAVDWLRTKE